MRGRQGRTMAKPGIFSRESCNRGRERARQWSGHEPKVDSVSPCRLADHENTSTLVPILMHSHAWLSIAAAQIPGRKKKTGSIWTNLFLPFPLLHSICIPTFVFARLVSLNHGNHSDTRLFSSAVFRFWLVFTSSHESCQSRLLHNSLDTRNSWLITSQLHSNGPQPEPDQSRIKRGVGQNHRWTFVGSVLSYGTLFSPRGRFVFSDIPHPGPGATRLGVVVLGT